MTFEYDVTVRVAIPLPDGERSDRACAIRVRGIGSGSGNPLTRNGREAPIPTSPRNPGLPGLRNIVRKSGKPDLQREEVELPARSQRYMPHPP
jgi:hypothetical protein